MTTGGKVKILSRIRFLGLFLIVGLFGLFNFSSVYAEEEPEYRIQLSPASISLDLHPGQTSTATFKVQNTGSKPFDYKLSAAPYSVENEVYDANLDAETNYTNIAKWISFSQDVGTIEPNEQDEITVRVSVPKDVPDGGQYGVILAQIVNDSGSDASGVAITQQVGLLVYSENVDGQTRKAGNVLENKVPGFLFTPPVRVTSVVENTGNVHANATYILQVFPLFGGEEIYTNEEQPTVLAILPETRRLNTMTWDGSPKLGIFKVKQTVKFLDQNNVTEKIVFICPIWFLLIILVLIFLIVFWIVSRVRGRKE